MRFSLLLRFVNATKGRQIKGYQVLIKDLH